VLVDLDRLGPKLGQLALGFGADELCGPIVEKRALRWVTTPAAARSRAPRQPSFCVEPGCAPRARGQEVGWRVPAVTLTPISERVNAGIPLSFDDGVALFREPDLLKLGALANQMREQRNGDRTTFNRNLHINPSNLCVAGCSTVLVLAPQP